MLNKNRVIKTVIEAVSKSLLNAKEAAQQAKNLATDEQSKAETQYDTVAIEAAFLAQGQSERSAELQSELTYWQRLRAMDRTNTHLIPGAFFGLESEQGIKRYYMLSEQSGGQKITVDNQTIFVISPSSPLGGACLDKELDDEVSFQGQYWNVFFIS